MTNNDGVKAMTNGRKPPATMPRTTNLPPTTHNINPMLEEYSGEAARAAQRFFDMAEQITSLNNELETWRTRAQVAEEELKRAANRERALESKLHATSERLTAERDLYRDRLVTLKAEFSMAGNIILNCIKVSEDMMSLRERADTYEHLDKLAQELDDELPKVVTAGPREDPT